MLAAAACLFFADGLRYENWFFSAAFSIVVILSAVLQWRQRRLSQRSVVFAGCALVITNAFPIFWMVTCYYFLGEWLPALQNEHFTHDAAATTWKIPVLLAASFPFELIASILGVVWVLKSDRRSSLCTYLAALIVAFTLFSFVSGGQLLKVGGAARYFLPHVALLLPFAGFLLARTLTGSDMKIPSVIAGCVLLLLMVGVDIVRVLNYPRYVSQDEINTGRTIRALEETGSIPQNGRILLERGKKWNYVAIVGLANKPERFVLLEESQLFKTCEHGFHTDVCKQTVSDGGFSLVILSSQKYALNFQELLNRRSWRIGAYHIFDANPSADGNPTVNGERESNYNTTQGVP
jgi:hypothetical protein